ncbi:MAG: multicopper oxidase family protein [bacterium]|nr:multicopper oxidase family protein [bacterium]
MNQNVVDVDAVRSLVTQLLNVKKLLVITALLLTGCQTQNFPEAKPSEVLEVSDGDQIRIDPTIVRKTINGKSFKMYGYNGQIPGPMIKAPQGATITIDSTNHIDYETTIHWHGLRLDNKSDGVPDVTQRVTEPGKSHQYTVTFPDEGIYWYHPHVREDIQQDMGLYGNLFIKPDDTSEYNPVNAEEVIVLDDLFLDANGENTPYGKSDPNFALMGRFGNQMLINGNTHYEQQFAKGSIVRMYFTNVANARTFRLEIPGAKLKLVGSDVGRYERDSFVDSVTIAPAERYIVEVLFAQAGEYTLLHKSPLAEFALGAFTITEEEVYESYAEAFENLRSYEDVIADIDAFRSEFDRPVDKTLRLTIDLEDRMAMMHEGMMMHHDETGIEWEDTMPMMNQMMASEDFQWKLVDEETGKANMEFMWKFTVGDIVKVRIINEEDSAHPMQHPIHFHGQRFLVLSEDDVAKENMVWKDTVLVPIGHTVDLLFDITNPGEWMFHCHIAEHLSNGMMGIFHVKPLEF